ncbi:MAG: hypothetical protein JXR76_08565 [Deltaproteobacteria bacterium]|nr:hypothetical protein [Deltaproteobacteria bacterium]
MTCVPGTVEKCDCAITCQSGYQPDKSGASIVTFSSTGAWSQAQVVCEDVEECVNGTASCPAHAQCAAGFYGAKKIGCSRGQGQ